MFNTQKIGKHDLFIFIARVCPHSNFQAVYRRTRLEPNSSVQCENENDVTPSAINLNRTRFLVF